MRDCKQCGKPVDGLDCPYCGYSETGKTVKAKAAVDPLRFVCQFITEGQRCAKAGSISPSTHGDGPWYCWEHYRTAMGMSKLGHSAPPKGFEALKAELTKKYPALVLYEREPGEEG